MSPRAGRGRIRPERHKGSPVSIGQSSSPVRRDSARDLAARLRAAGRPLLGGAWAGRRCPVTCSRSATSRGADDEPLDELLTARAAVVHLAGRSARDARDRRAIRKAAYRAANVEVTARLARASVRAGVRRLRARELREGCGRGESAAVDRSRPGDTPASRGRLRAQQARGRAGALVAIAGHGDGGGIALRLPLVYGRHANGNFARLVARRRRAAALPLASIDNRRSLLYLGNLRRRDPAPCSTRREHAAWRALRRRCGERRHARPRARDRERLARAAAPRRHARTAAAHRRAATRPAARPSRGSRVARGGHDLVPRRRPAGRRAGRSTRRSPKSPRVATPAVPRGRSL